MFHMAGLYSIEASVQYILAITELASGSRLTVIVCNTLENKYFMEYRELRIIGFTRRARHNITRIPYNRVDENEHSLLAFCTTRTGLMLPRA